MSQDNKNTTITKDGLTYNLADFDFDKAIYMGWCATRDGDIVVRLEHHVDTGRVTGFHQGNRKFWRKDGIYNILDLRSAKLDLKLPVLIEPEGNIEIPINQEIYADLQLQQANATDEENTNNSISGWRLFNKSKIPQGETYLGYNKDWECEDFNPSGIRLFYKDGDDECYSSDWDNDYDTWDAVMGDPSHYMPLPSKPL